MAGVRSRRLVIEATMNAKGVVTGARKVETTTEKMGRGISKAAGALGALGAAFTAAAVIQGLKSVIGSASDLEESVNAVEVATGDAADEIMAFGDTAAQELGLSKKAINEAAVAFASFGEKINENDVAGTFKEFATRATDFASVMNLDVQEALDKFRSGLAGESEPLRKFGLDLSAASVGAFAVATGIAKSASKMTEAQKVQARYGLLMKQTDKFAGDFANTSDGLANTTRRLSAEWENAQAVLGQKLLPVMEDLMNTSVDLVPVLASVLGYFVDIAADAGETAVSITNLGEAIVGATDEMGLSEDASNVFGDVLGFVTQNVFALTNTLASAGPGSLVGAFRDVHEWLSAVDEEAVRNVEAFEASRQKTIEFHEELEEAAVQARDVDAAAAGLSPSLDGVASSADDAAAAVRNLADEQRSLVDPVFRLIRAQETYDRVLKEVTADGVLAKDEAVKLAKAHLDLAAATAAVTPEAMEEYKAVIEEVREGVVEDFGKIQESMSNLGSPGNLERAEAFLRRVEALQLKPIKIDFGNLNIASPASIERALERKLAAMQRRGEIGLWRM